MSSLEDYYPSIIRLLDVQVIGPYLVKRGVLSSQDYYDNYVGPLQKGETSNYKLSLKLTNKCLKKPKDFLEALEESLNSTNHADHQELLETLSAVGNDSVNAKKKNLVHRAAHKVKKRVFAKQSSVADIHISQNNTRSDHSMMRHYSNTDVKNSDEITQDKSAELQTGWSFKPPNASNSSLDLPPTHSDCQPPLRLTGSLKHLNRSLGNSVSHIKQCNGSVSLPSSPTCLPRQHRSGSLSIPLSYSTTAKTETELYQQSKLEIERLKERNKFQEEVLKKLQSECDELKSQVKELERLKEREGLQKEMIEKFKSENKQLNEHTTELKVEVATLNEKLSNTKENEEQSKAARNELEKCLQSLQSKVETMTVQVESADVKLNSKQEKIEHVEAQNRDLRKQITELKQKLTQQQTQARIDHSKHQKEIEKYQQRCEQMENQVQEKDNKLSNIEGKMENTSENLKQIQEILANLNEKEEIDDPPSLHKQDSGKVAEVIIRKNGVECSKQQLVLECSKQDLVDIIEVYIEQIEELHHKVHLYQCEIRKLKLKLKSLV
ncbi:putative leucine-rich repeat-containing protein DDB_G0290503 [Dysidea avara]|uniref:putative leucine-rich repeat-containing protein DDB_G0290503 n=1 Tax=Dysidea avara TaxID=196820 RepID=UPI00332697B6